MLLRRREFVKGVTAAGLALMVGGPRLAHANRPTYGHVVYDWYCDEFFDFRSALPATDRAFIDRALNLEGNAWVHDIGDDFIYSTITFSHRVEGDRVNSSRVAMASIKHADALRPLIAGVLKSRGVNVDALPDFDKVIGLGWDVEEDHLKAYFYLPDITGSRDPEVLGLLGVAEGEAHYPVGLSSFTVTGAGADVYEKKLYLAMKDRVPAHAKDHPFQEQIVHTNYMITTRRGVVPQVDVQQPFNPASLSGPGEAIAARYASRTPPESLDTFSYRDSSSYTLYFP